MSNIAVFGSDSAKAESVTKSLADKGNEHLNSQVKGPGCTPKQTAKSSHQRSRTVAAEQGGSKWERGAHPKTRNYYVA